jgi:polyphosphate kinase
VAARDSLTGQYRDPQSYLNRELSWLYFARRVISLAEDPGLPLLERVKFAGIAGMLHDEFFMKRMSGLKRQMARSTGAGGRTSIDGRTPQEEFQACRRELLDQASRVDALLQEQLRPAMESSGIPILDHDVLERGQKSALRDYFRESVAPILTPLAVDAEHPFPFISNLGLNLAILFVDAEDGGERFVRLKVPNNRPRWIPLPGGAGFVPLEQVITANLDLLYPDNPPVEVHHFRVTRGRGGREAGGDHRPGEQGAEGAPLRRCRPSSDRRGDARSHAPMARTRAAPHPR